VAGEIVQNDHVAGSGPGVGMSGVGVSAPTGFWCRDRTSRRSYPKMPSRLTMPVTFAPVADSPATKLQGMWLAPLKSPSPAAEEIPVRSSLEIPNLKLRDTL
jgi:hypothetical protein